MGIQVIALSDDLTGAVAVAAEAVTEGFTARVASAENIPATCDSDVIVVDTNSRLCPDSEALEKIGKATADLMGNFGAEPLYYKRVDSLLRGPIIAETTAWRAIVRLPALVATAAPALGIKTLQGEQWVRDQVVVPASGGVDRARTTPAGILEARLASLLHVRSHSFADELATALRNGHSLVADAETPQDMLRVGAAVAEARAGGVGFCLVGSFGLLGAYLAARGTGRRRGFLVAASSYRAAAAAQLEAFAARANCTMIIPDERRDDAVDRATAAISGGRDVALVTLSPGTQPDNAQDRYARDLAECVAKVLERVRPAGVATLGGELASRLFRLLAPRHVEVLAEPWPATPVVEFVGGAQDGLRAVIQSGSQGDARRLIQIAAFFQTLNQTNRKSQP